MKSGIYYIKNLETNQYYIGSSYNIKNRWRQHRRDLRNDQHCNTYLQRSWNKYGKELFEFGIVEHCEIVALEEREKIHISNYKSMVKEGGFNCLDPIDRTRNVIISDEQKKVLSEQKLGSKNPMYGKFGSAHPSFGKKFSEEHKNKISIARKLIVGENASNAKLTNQQVLEIRSKYVPRVYSTTRLAQEYSVSQGTIMNIIKNRGWKHVH